MRIPEVVVFLASLAGLATVAAVYFGRLTVAMALDVGMLLACLTWLFFLVKIPWDLYFAARRARLDGQESQRLGIERVQAQTQQLATMERFLLGGALGGHVVTAAGVYALAFVHPDLVSPGFTWLFVASAGLRPAWEAYVYLRRRIGELASQVRYPREDIHTLNHRFTEHQAVFHNLERHFKQSQDAAELRFQQLDMALQQLQSRQISEMARLEKRTVQLTQRFEEVVEKMSSDQDLLAGVRAFARMMREPTSA